MAWKPEFQPSQKRRSYSRSAMFRRFLRVLVREQKERYSTENEIATHKPVEIGWQAIISCQSTRHFSFVSQFSPKIKGLMTKKSYKHAAYVIPHVTRSSLHPYINLSTIHESPWRPQAVWTIQCPQSHILCHTRFIAQGMASISLLPTRR